MKNYLLNSSNVSTFCSSIHRRNHIKYSRPRKRDYILPISLFQSYLRMRLVDSSTEITRILNFEIDGALFLRLQLFDIIKLRLKQYCESFNSPLKTNVNTHQSANLNQNLTFNRFRFHFNSD